MAKANLITEIIIIDELKGRKVLIFILSHQVNDSVDDDVHDHLRNSLR